MALARMTQSRMNTLFALAVGRHNLALCQTRKHQFPFEKKSGLRPFRKWSRGETTVFQTATLLSQISLSPSPRSVGSLSLVANYRIGHREREYCHSTTILGSRCCETKCAQGVRNLTYNQFEEELNIEIQKRLSGRADPKRSEIGEKRGRDSESDSDEPGPKKRKIGDETDMDAPKSADPAPKISGEQLQLFGQEDSNNLRLNQKSRLDRHCNDVWVNVDFEMKGDGEYILKTKRVTASSTDEDKVERAEQMAQKAAILLLYGEMLLDMGRKLRAQSQASLNSIFEGPAPSNSESD